MLVTSPDSGHAPWSPLRPTAAGFAVGLLLALATSGGIAGERITRGALHVALFANAVTTLAALVAVVFTMKRPGTSVGPRGRRKGRALAELAPQALGAVAGIVLVHAVLHRQALTVLPWLSERPAQFVNDFVAVAGVLALVWASAAGLDARLLVLAFLGMSLYRVTSSFWHLDHAPGGFQTSVQQLVVAQFVAAALALGLFRTVTNRAER